MGAYYQWLLTIAYFKYKQSAQEPDRPIKMALFREFGNDFNILDLEYDSAHKNEKEILMEMCLESRWFPHLAFFTWQLSPRTIWSTTLTIFMIL